MNILYKTTLWLNDVITVYNLVNILYRITLWLNDVITVYSLVCSQSYTLCKIYGHGNVFKTIKIMSLYEEKNWVISLILEEDDYLG